ncbi:MAG TPA: hypothetical protein VD794_11155 [Flavisolibacter sp.]|nr:hypothetical protein [Flavisolibacter sp.]
MNILYISYWELADGLTQSTVLPHLQVLANSDKIKQITFLTIERSSKRQPLNPSVSEKVKHIPLVSKNLPVNLINKINDFVYFPRQIEALIKSNNINAIIARGAPAGALVYKISKRMGVPYYVESFEPHAHYMLESNVWKPWDPRYLFQLKWERAIKKSATGLMPVSQNYRLKLEHEGVASNRLFTVPCSVNLNEFEFNSSKRLLTRQELEIGENEKVAIYVGKFGGIYYDQEAFLLFKKLLSINPLLRFIIITPDKHEAIYEKLSQHELDSTRFSIKTVLHKEVPAYLSAADFALATIKPSKSRKYCSAIKVGEYWANGLPVLITPGVGDDSDLIDKLNIGVVLDPNWQNKEDSYFSGLLCRLEKSQERLQIQQVARKYRNIQSCIDAYQFFSLI